VLKFNPFQPNKIVAPGMFVGRVEELDQIEKCLFQTQHENPQNFLIIGERGIGKSSLLFYVDILASGAASSIDGEKFNFVTCSIDLGSCQTELDIVRNVAKGLRDALSDEQKKIEAAKKIVDFLSNWEILGVRYHRPDLEIDPEDVCDQLVLQIAEFCKSLQGDKSGILLLLDEADQPLGGANLGKFCKYFTERLTKKGCNSLAIGIAGLPIVLDRLRESHESSPRLFEIVHLETLKVEERKQVVQIGIELADKKNAQKTTISEVASKLLAELSEGYPHFVQQFAHSAFDTDGNPPIFNGT
jgi:Cdc6-like AAA superfamily ATPase